MRNSTRCGPQLLSRRFFQHESGRTCSQRLAEGLVIVVRREHQHGRCVVAASKASDCFRAIDPLHTHVHENKVRVDVTERVGDFVAVRTLAHDLECSAALEYQANAISHERLIVDNDHVDGSCFGFVGVENHPTSIPPAVTSRGTQPVTSQPSFVGPAARCPPSKAVRSVMPCNPRPLPLPITTCEPIELSMRNDTRSSSTSSHTPTR